MAKAEDQSRKRSKASKGAPSTADRGTNGKAPAAPAPDLTEQLMAHELDNLVPTREYDELPMVGLGGSAGSIPALRAFFEAMPPDSGMVFVVIIHLSPEHESTMPALLGRETAMKVVAAQDGEKVRENTVYVIPPGKLLTAANGHLKLTPLEREHGRRIAVDLFFRSLADTHGPHATAIVLSGADGDGASGLRRIKERGGLTIAQAPDEAEHSGMPRAAVATGMVDWVLRASEIPQRLMDYHRMAQQLKLPPEEGPQPATAPRPPQHEREAALRDVLTFVRMRTGRDFTCYKRATILRRISRRMQVNGVNELPNYLSYLRTHPGEAGALLKDLLISVTTFFRDREAFNELEKCIPRLFEGKSQSDTVRIWVPACATGEEAYSIAILAIEHARKLDNPPAIQVFGCDLDEEAVQVARQGFYPESIAADVSGERLRGFFVKEHNGYRICREVRELMLFVAHDLLKDAPFSRMDLISCRNLLIYLTGEGQNRVLDTFHFALRPGGLLFLGLSESVEDGSHLFRVLDKKHRLYEHIPAARIGLPVPKGPSLLVRQLAEQAQADRRPTLPGSAFMRSGALPVTPPRPEALREEEQLSWAEIHYKLIERFAPPSIVVNADHDIQHMSESAGRFLQMSGGPPTTNLVRLIHPMLRVELRSLLFRVGQSGETAEASRVPVDLHGTGHLVDIRVSRAADLAPDYLLVTFEESPQDADDRRAPSGSAPATPKTDPVVHLLEREIEQNRGQLRDTVEQYEASTEELKASNEELQAMNEELRSASEELETSREELQSINEELTTVNAELKVKVDELGHTNSDLQNLMASTAIATVFLDRELRITRFTPSAVSIFHLIPSDVGRPLSDLRHRLEYPSLQADVQQVLDTLIPVEREVAETNDAGTYLARLLPYRTLDDHIGGVVLTFVDITERRRAERDLAEELEHTERLRAVSERIAPEGDMHALFEDILEVAIAITRADAGTVQLLDPANRQLTLLTTKGLSEEMVNRFGHVVASVDTPCSKALIAGRRVFLDFENPGGSECHESDAAHLAEGLCTAQSTPLINRSGRCLGMLTTHSREKRQPTERQLRFIDLLARQAADAVERQQSMEALRQSEERFRAVIENAREYAVISMDLNRHITMWNAGAMALLGYEETEVLDHQADFIFTREDRDASVPEHEAAAALRDGRATDERWHVRKDGSRFWGSGSMMAIHNVNGEAIGLMKILRDQTEARHAHTALEKRVEERTGELRAANEELKTLPRRVLGAQEAERMHLARELHDQIGQQLTGLNMLVHRLAEKSPETVQPDLEDASRAITNILGRVRKLSIDLRPPILDDLGLRAAVQAHAKEYANATGLKVNIDVAQFEEAELSPECKIIAFRLIQESLTNTARHAHATQVSLRLKSTLHTLLLEMVDDGKGFKMNQSTSGGGLRGMRERVLLAQGKLEVDSALGKGTRIRVELPCHAGEAPAP